MKMKVKIKKISFIELGVYCSFLFLPFTLFFNNIIFNEFKIAGIGIMNLFLYLFLLIVFIDSIINRNLYYNRQHIYIFYCLFFVIHILKFLQNDNDLNTFLNYFKKNQYYYVLPMVLLALSNKKINFEKLSGIIVNPSIIICIISIVMFLTNNYYGLADDKVLLTYKIVGTSFVRMLSIFVSPLTAGAYFAIVIAIIYYTYNFNNWYYRLLGLLNLLCMVLTFSKTAIIALVMMFICKYMFDNKGVLNKFSKISIVIISVILAIIFMSDKGIYFWNVNELFHNIRLSKWRSSSKLITSHIFLGNKFDIFLNMTGRLETILSDNSFLLASAIFGVVFWLIILIYEIIHFYKKDKELRQVLFPIIIMALIFLNLYDFIQLFPANFLMIALYEIVKNKYKNK